MAKTRKIGKITKKNHGKDTASNPKTIIESSNHSKAHETRDNLAVSVRRLFWSISIHCVAIHSWNLRRSHKLQNKTL